MSKPIRSLEPWLNKFIAAEIAALLRWKHNTTGKTIVKDDPDYERFLDDGSNFRAEVDRSNSTTQFHVQLMKVLSISPTIVELSDSEVFVRAVLTDDAVKSYAEQLDEEFDESFKYDILRLDSYALTVSSYGPNWSLIKLDIDQLKWVSARHKPIGTPSVLHETPEMQQSIADMRQFRNNGQITSSVVAAAGHAQSNNKRRAAHSKFPAAQEPIILSSTGVEVQTQFPVATQPAAPPTATGSSTPSVNEDGIEILRGVNLAGPRVAGFTTAKRPSEGTPNPLLQLIEKKNRPQRTTQTNADVVRANARPLDSASRVEAEELPLARTAVDEKLRSAQMHKTEMLPPARTQKDPAVSPIDISASSRTVIESDTLDSRLRFVIAEDQQLLLSNKSSWIPVARESAPNCPKVPSDLLQAWIKNDSTSQGEPMVVDDAPPTSSQAVVTRAIAEAVRQMPGCSASQRQMAKPESSDDDSTGDDSASDASGDGGREEGQKGNAGTEDDDDDGQLGASQWSISPSPPPRPQLPPSSSDVVRATPSPAKCRDRQNVDKGPTSTADSIEQAVPRRATSTTAQGAHRMDRRKFMIDGQRRNWLLRNYYGPDAKAFNPVEACTAYAEQFTNDYMSVEAVKAIYEEKAHATTLATEKQSAAETTKTRLELRDTITETPDTEAKGHLEVQDTAKQDRPVVPLADRQRTTTTNIVRDMATVGHHPDPLETAGKHHHGSLAKMSKANTETNDGRLVSVRKTVERDFDKNKAMMPTPPGKAKLHDKMAPLSSQDQIIDSGVVQGASTIADNDHNRRNLDERMKNKKESTHNPDSHTTADGARPLSHGRSHPSTNTVAKHSKEPVSTPRVTTMPHSTSKTNNSSSGFVPATVLKSSGEQKRHVKSQDGPSVVSQLLSRVELDLVKSGRIDEPIKDAWLNSKPGGAFTKQQETPTKRRPQMNPLKWMPQCGPFSHRVTIIVQKHEPAERNTSCYRSPFLRDILRCCRDIAATTVSYHAKCWKTQCEYQGAGLLRFHVNRTILIRRPQPQIHIREQGHRSKDTRASTFSKSRGCPRRQKATLEKGTEDMAELTRESSASLRRQSFSENGDNHDQLLALKKIVSQESERREKDSSVQEAIPEAAIESTPISTPTLEPKEDQALSMKAPSKLSTTTTANPDKPVTAATEEEVALKPADPTDAKAVSVGDALDADAEDLSENARPKSTASKPTKDTAARSKPAPVSSASTKPVAAALKSPLITKQASKAAPKELSQKVSRSSLTAPTAASVARAAEKRESLASNASTAAKGRARESTKPVSISSHLLAPTAASRAKHEQDFGRSVDSRSSRGLAKASTTRPAPRTSLAHAPSSESQNTGRKPVASDGSFLDRMTRPTAASQSRAQEKYDGKPPARKALPLHKKATVSKLNGTTKHPAAVGGPITPTAGTVEAEDDDSIFDLSSGTPVKPSAGEEPTSA
ncbi:hypothetical protein AMS68_002615 [Peltaster fructicola]|uniref:Telomere replication protein EST3 n=1 Tax=Peltaster fructicola TaxID=286661 RepID=A0A6H0XR32_9PEZI|nr:hypothetical protein AMS68_002615 [Peltaster fructicola]